MAQFIATCPRGMVDALAAELKELDLKVIESQAGGVIFDSNWEGCYKANLCSRLASRILKPVLDFTAYQPDELYGQILNHDFTKYIKPNQTLTIDVVIKESKMRDQRFVAMKIKDAIVDQFREVYGERPNIDNDNPALRVHVKGYKNQFNVAIDTSGDSLFQRGYRTEFVEAPVKENLAAGLIKLSGWDQKSPLLDFMCGSGTFLIEAAMMALNIAPGIHRKKFGFMNLANFDRAAWDKVVEEAISKEKEDLDFKLYGYDIDRKAIVIAKNNARNAGVDHVIEFSREAVATVNPPVEKGIIIVNPPYGIRIGDEDNVRDVYRDLSYTLKNKFKGWDAWVLSGNKDLIADLKLKSTRKIFVFNGNIECRFLKYSMF
jgi:putative N6-adenine-specific DNA methylase